MISRGCRKKRSWPNLRQTCYPGICVKGLRKTRKISLRIASFGAEMWKQLFPNTKQDGSSLGYDVQLFYNVRVFLLNCLSVIPKHLPMKRGDRVLRFHKSWDSESNLQPWALARFTSGKFVRYIHWMRLSIFILVTKRKIPLPVLSPLVLQRCEHSLIFNLNSSKPKLV
jgi:hypothetical protein